jgi:pimeloyl-ACP methyl ester carboxylesterase
MATGGGAGVDLVHCVPWLPRAGFRVVAIARPGYHGVPFDLVDSLEAQADLYAAALTGLDIHDPVHVFGVSAGGPTALYFASKHPTRSLLLWSAVTGPYTPNQESMDSPLGRLILSPRGQNLISWMLARSARLATRATMKTFLEAEAMLEPAEAAAVLDHELSDPERRAEFVCFVDSTTPMSDLYTGMMGELAMMADDWSPEWSEITAPTLAVASPVDKDVSFDHAERISEVLPHAQTIHVRAGGHFVWWGEEGEAVVEESLAFLRGT